MERITLRIDNMHCGSCIRRVTQTLNALPASHAEEVRLGSARIATEASHAVIRDTMAAAGYPTTIEADGR